MAKRKAAKALKALALFIVIAAVMTGIFTVVLNSTEVFDIFFSEETTTTTEAPTTATKPPAPYVTSTATVRSAGDVLIHVPVYTAAKTADGYNFDNIFTYTSSLIEDCDYFVANLETTLAGTSRSYSGFPRFNSPDGIVTSLKKAGVDCLLTANNHTYDTNNHGVLRTQQIVEEAGFDYTGTRKTAEDKKYFIADVNDIKFGFLCYSYETPAYEGRKALNGLLVDEETAPLINSFNYDELSSFYKEVKKLMNTMKKKGAEVITVYLHWGNEYQLTQDKNQKAIAQKLCDLGVDVIIGGHPHVVQPVELITSADGSHKTVCVYSVGNMLSNQRRSYMGLKTGHTEDGLTFEMTFSKYSDGTVTFDSVKAIPTWVHLYKESGKTVYNIVPLTGNLDSRAEKLGLTKTSDGLSQAKASYERTMALVKKGTDECNKWLKGAKKAVTS